MTDPMPRVTIAQIQQATAEHFGISLSKILGSQKMREFARPRQIAMYLARELTGASYPQIARKFNREDHTTARHAAQLIKELRRRNSYFAEHDTHIGTAIEKISNNIFRGATLRCSDSSVDLLEYWL